MTIHLYSIYKSGAKNAVSALNEFCALQRRRLDIKEVGVSLPTLAASFASQCFVDDEGFPLLCLVFH
jgi:hypothetical protein